VGGLLAAFFLFALGAYLHSKRRQVITGKEGLIGSVGRATSSLSPGGQVFVAGEIWRARAEGDSIPEGEEVEVVRLEGFTVVVRPRGRKS
jgi:membrane-bound serine protease (ClpP class)